MIGYPMDSLIFKRCDKSFRFGGDSGHARWMVELPVRIADHPGRIQAYVIYGATPMLFARPLLEALQAEVNFGAAKSGSSSRPTRCDAPPPGGKCD